MSTVETPQPSLITGSMLYDFIQCPTRVELDLYGDYDKADPVNPFIQMLWERGRLYEEEVLGDLDVSFLDLSKYSSAEKERLTNEAMSRGETLILGARIQCDGLLGAPDLLRKEECGYVAGDIKSGAGEEGLSDNKKPKKHYAVQLALYTDILERKKMSAGRYAFVWDIHGDEVSYDFTQPMGARTATTYWEFYTEVLEKVDSIIIKKLNPVPASSGDCKLCRWYSVCRQSLKKKDDLSLIPELGRSRRDSLLNYFETIKDLATSTKLPAKVPGIGQPMLELFQRRAKLLATPNQSPYLLKDVPIPVNEKEIFFDVETDPMRDICYLHGFVERLGGLNGTEKYISFFADKPTREDEKKAFKGAFEYLYAAGGRFYYYSKYERTYWRKLQNRYPEICSIEQIENLFSEESSMDLLYDYVKKYTVWPTTSHSIKELAVFLGFSWRDTHPSGAASIEWYDQWVRSTDTAHKLRILDYNEDDCKATAVLLDGMRTFKVGPQHRP